MCYWLFVVCCLSFVLCPILCVICRLFCVFFMVVSFVLFLCLLFVVGGVFTLSAALSGMALSLLCHCFGFYCTVLTTAAPQAPLSTRAHDVLTHLLTYSFTLLARRRIDDAMQGLALGYLLTYLLTN